MAEGLRGEVVKFLKEHHVMTLGTCAEDLPWSAAVYYASDDLRLYFFSDPNSRHCANLRRNPAVSAAIHENWKDYRDIRGLQLEGRVEALPVTDLPAALNVYVGKFPFVKDFLTPEGWFRIGGKVVGARFYRLLPSRLYLLDNRKGFSHREEYVVP